MKIRILPYKQGSKSAKVLADALGGKVLKLEGSAYSPSYGDLVINWGNTQTPPPGSSIGYWGGTKNNAATIKKASNKREFFNAMVAAGLQSLIPRFWTNKDAIPADAYPVVCRTVLAGHSGDGIVIASGPAELVSAPLYVEYKKKKDEYRVHVGKKSDLSITTIAVQRKARRTDFPAESVNWQVRNHCNGFVFVRQGVNPPSSVLKAASDALGCCGLDFGAVDVIFNTQEGKPYVLEINTAPGLEGQTVEDYANFFKSVG